MWLLRKAVVTDVLVCYDRRMAIATTTMTTIQLLRELSVAR